MSYYQNVYPSYPQFGTQQYAAVQPMSAPQQAPALNGKIVDSVEMVRATEVPIGGYGVFPKADLNEVYIKTWNPNGTTSVTTYAPTAPIKQEEPEISLRELLEKINAIETKIDNALASPQPEVKEKPIKREVKSNAY